MRDRLIASTRTVAASRWSYPVLGVLMLCASGLDAALLRRPPSAASVLLALGAAASVGLCGWRPLVSASVLAAVLVAIGLGNESDAAPAVSFLAPAIVAYACAVHTGARVAVLAAVALIASFEVATVITSDTWVPDVYIVLAPWFVGRAIGGRRRLVSELEQRTKELEHERRAFALLAVRRERARIARELHDIVSHNMAVMVVQAGAGRLAAGGDARAAAETFQRIRTAGRAALAEMDQLVDVLGLHPGAPDARTLASVADLVDQARAAGLDVTAELSLRQSALPAEIEHAAYRAIQEGLTNVLKHAPGSQVKLRVDARDDELEIEVRNHNPAATGTHLADTGSRLGLAGIEQRLGAHGGEVWAGPLEDGGWRFLARLSVETSRSEIGLVHRKADAKIAPGVDDG
ncbi:MAG TPA: histidine kinase [Solirubrobacteraceae bacterium]|nr:histidine kinase [Solirubrobacteraceae bacterium]